MTWLGDSGPLGIALTVGYLLAVAFTVRAAAGRETPRRDRRLWVVTATALLMLGVNQQGDLHSRALRAGSDLLESFGIAVQSPPILVISAAVLICAAAVTVILVAGAVRRGWPPGTMAVLGFMIIAVHGLVRGARFLHVTPGTWIEGPLRGDMRWLEAAGLALVLLGVHRFGGRDVAGVPELEPDAAERAPTLSRRRLIRWALVASVAMLTLITGTAAYMTNWMVGGIERFADPFTSLSDRPPEPSGNDPVAGREPTTILLLGSDLRDAADRPFSWEDGGRADTIMLLNLPGSRRTAHIVSIPRESWVRIPGHGEGRINEAYSHGGPALMVQTVEELTKVRIDHVVALDYQSVAALTDALGGVDLTVEEASYSYDGLVATAGTHHMDGRQALAYLSQNNGLERGDLDRIPRQQDWLQAMATRISDPSFLKEPRGLIDGIRAASRTLAVDEEFDLLEMAQLAWQLRAVQPDDVGFQTAGIESSGMSPDKSQTIVTLDEQWLDRLAEAVAADTMDRFSTPHPEE